MLLPSSQSQSRPTEKSDLEEGGGSKRKSSGKSNSEFSLRPAYRRHRFRAASFERRLVEISLLFLALSAIWLIFCGITFIVYRGSREAYAADGKLQHSDNDSSAENYYNIPPSNHTKIVDEVAAWLAVHRFPYAKLARACSAHVRAVPFASAGFFALGLVYLISGGCPWTTCAKFRSRMFTGMRIASGVLLAATSLVLAELLAFPTYCMYRQYRDRGENLEDPGSPKFPTATEFTVLTASAVYAVLYSGLYARFAANELGQKLKLQGHTN